MADRQKSPRRRIWVVVGIVATIVIYGLAVERTGVSLDEITSETRQQQLVRIIRNLANPDLVTYDFEQARIEVEYFIPCPSGDESPATNQGLIVDPGCGEPEQVVIVTGTGYEPFQDLRLEFVPDSEFDVVLQMGRFTTDGDGILVAEIELPNRPSDQPQILRAVVAERIGSWRDRQEVWTDINENGIRDDGIVGPDGIRLTVEGAQTDTPAAALLDPTRQVSQFVTTGEPFIAVSGPAIGVTADPIGDVTNEVVYIEALESSGNATTVVLAGDEGANVSDWRVAIYDGESGEVLNTAPLGDQIELSPRVSRQTILTVDKIIDTVFLALVATTLGLLVALPLSFIAARNLMKDVSASVLGLGLGLIAIPMGIVVGALYISFQRSLLGEAAGENIAQAALLIVGGGLALTLARLIFFGGEHRSNLRRFAISIGLALTTAAALEGFFGLLTAGGQALEEPFGIFAFIPGLFATIGEVGTLLLPFLIGAFGAVITVGLANRAAFWLTDHGTSTLRHGVGYLVMTAAGAMIGLLLGALIDWLYQVANPVATALIPGLVGGLWGLWIADRGRHRGEIRIGLTLYYIARTIFNMLRSIEPLVMVIVFVVWVGFGEFAGSLALALHTAASLAKLYSEQVENIAEGPMEAVRATGATRLQSVVYSVIPQIVPPYIAFTMYRWDINVRMSTILGFAGGGGIGFLLQQNITLGDYSAAAVQMLAIAIVVASMDYTSSKLRQRFT